MWRIQKKEGPHKQQRKRLVMLEAAETSLCRGHYVMTNNMLC